MRLRALAIAVVVALAAWHPVQAQAGAIRILLED